MIPGHWAASGPVIAAEVLFPPNLAVPTPFQVSFLIDTGAAYTILGPTDTARLSRYVAVSALPPAPQTVGVGGAVQLQTINAGLIFPGYTVTISLPTLRLYVANPSNPAAVTPVQAQVPSLFGRDALSAFGLYLEESSQKARLLEPPDLPPLLFPGSPLV